MSALGPFNPAIDRYDRRSAARLFQSLWSEDTVAIVDANPALNKPQLDEPECVVPPTAA